MQIVENRDIAPGAWFAAVLGSLGLAVSWAAMYYVIVWGNNSNDLFWAFLLAMLLPILALAIVLMCYVGIARLHSRAHWRIYAGTSLIASVGAAAGGVMLLVAAGLTPKDEGFTHSNALSFWQFDAGILIGALTILGATRLVSRWVRGWPVAALSTNAAAFAAACFFAYRLINWFMFEWNVGA